MSSGEYTRLRFEHIAWSRSVRTVLLMMCGHTLLKIRSCGTQCPPAAMLRAYSRFAARSSPMITVFGAMRMQVKVCVRGLCAVDVRMDVNPVPAHAGQRPGADGNQSQPHQR